MAAYNIYEAKAAFSQLVDRAAKGEEIIVAKAGKPLVKMVPIDVKPKKRDWSRGKELFNVTFVAPNFDEAVWTDEELDEFGF